MGTTPRTNFVRAALLTQEGNFEPTTFALPDSVSSTLIDELLAEQQRLTAVDHFARLHERGEIPAEAKYYRNLIPLTKPQPGQQYAFEVNLDRCSGCTACVSACHSLNGLDDEETWRNVGLLFSQDWQQPFQQTVTTACHHCLDPGCLNGCPVLAYDKDPVTGIVKHLDDQCIGCQYCVMKCPYEVPKFSAKRGIVRKCDMCSSRLEVGEAPACVQACPTEAIRIVLTSHEDIAAAAARDEFLPSAPRPGYTLPSTRYRSGKPLVNNLLAGDHAHNAPAESHLPLVFMLVLSQLAVGASVSALLISNFRSLKLALMLIAAAAGALAPAIASLHLGKPMKAWRAFLGWRKSWFSREVIAFGIFAPLAAAALLATFGEWKTLSLLLGISAGGVGLCGVGCSAMIYVDTHREFWSAPQSFGKFFGTTILLGAATTLFVSALVRVPPVVVVIAAGLTVAGTAFKIGVEFRIFRHLVSEDRVTLTSLNKSARLLENDLGSVLGYRNVCAAISGMICPALLIPSFVSGSLPWQAFAIAAFVFALAGELLERYLYFTAVAPVRMPGRLVA